MQELLDIARSMDTMRVLCGVPINVSTASKDVITDLDLSGKMLGPEGSFVLSNYLQNNNTVLSVLNISCNQLKSEGGKHIAETIKVTYIHKLEAYVHLSAHSLSCCCLLFGRT
jgi:hypothetical protein